MEVGGCSVDWRWQRRHRRRQRRRCRGEARVSGLRRSHSVAPVDDLVLIAGDLEALAVLLGPHHRDVGQPLLACGEMGQAFALLGSGPWVEAEGHRARRRPTDGLEHALRHRVRLRWTTAGLCDLSIFS